MTTTLAFLEVLIGPVDVRDRPHVACCRPLRRLIRLRVAERVSTLDLHFLIFFTHSKFAHRFGVGHIVRMPERQTYRATVGRENHIPVFRRDRNSAGGFADYFDWFGKAGRYAGPGLRPFLALVQTPNSRLITGGKRPEKRA